MMMSYNTIQFIEDKVIKSPYMPDGKKYMEPGEDLDDFSHSQTI